MARWLPASLRARLLWLLFAAIALAAGAQALVAYRIAMAEADQIADAHMQRTAMALRTGLPESEWTRPPDDDAPAADARHEPQHDEDDFIVQVWTVQGVLLFRSVARPALPPQARIGFSDVAFDGVAYRVFALVSPTHVIEVAQDTAARRASARALALRTIAPLAVATPLLLALAWWAVSASLAPLQRVRAQVAERQPDDLSELAEPGLPAEVQPLVDEMNGLFERVRRAFAAQKAFVDDASHELRSPLAALKLQVQGLRGARDGAAREALAVRLEAGIDRAAHLVDQLLVLARQQAGAAGAVEGPPPQPVALAELLRLELAEAQPKAQARSVDLGLEHADEVSVSGRAEPLRVLLRNLLDNAIRHGGAGGRVDVTLRRDAGRARLTVEDSGPGIAADQRARVLDRFYRVPGTDAAGSGLGLAIVKAIAELHGATLTLDRSARLGGLSVMLLFDAID